MIKRSLLSLLLLVITFASTSVIAVASERLHYRLSYSGLITGFFWKKLADVTFNIEPEAIQFRGDGACRLNMEVDTSDYLFAEMIHPVRYRWESTLTPNLQRTLLARAIDIGKSNIHEVSWYDWESGTISLFRKRRAVAQNQSSDRGEKNIVWERDIHAPPATFIDPKPQIENGLKYLIQTGEFTGVLSEPAIDPLAMILRIRNQNFEQSGELPMLVALDEKLHRYHARLKEQTSLKIGNQIHHSTLNIEVRRASTNGRKGAMHLWLSNDPRRLPLRIDVNAPLGMIHLELLRTEENPEPKLCPPLHVIESKTGSS